MSTIRSRAGMTLVEGVVMAGIAVAVVGLMAGWSAHGVRQDVAMDRHLEFLAAGCQVLSAAQDDVLRASTVEVTEGGELHLVPSIGGGEIFYWLEAGSGALMRNDQRVTHVTLDGFEVRRPGTGPMVEMVVETAPPPGGDPAACRIRSRFLDRSSQRGAKSRHWVAMKPLFDNKETVR